MSTHSQRVSSPQWTELLELREGPRPFGAFDECFRRSKGAPALRKWPRKWETFSSSDLNPTREPGLLPLLSIRCFLALATNFTLLCFSLSHPSYLLTHPHIPFALLHFTIWHSSDNNDSLCEAIFLAQET